MDEWVEKVPIWEEGCEGVPDVKRAMKVVRGQALLDGMAVAYLSAWEANLVGRLVEACASGRVVVCKRVESPKGRELVVCVREGRVWKPLAILWGTQEE